MTAPSWSRGQGVSGEDSQSSTKSITEEKTQKKY